MKRLKSMVAPVDLFEFTRLQFLFQQFPPNFLQIPLKYPTFAPRFTHLYNFLAASMQAGRRENSFSIKVLRELNVV